MTRCAWRQRAGRRCAEPAEALDAVWRRWLCRQHADQMLVKQWAALESAEIAHSLGRPGQG